MSLTICIIPYITPDLKLAKELRKLGAAGLRVYAGFIGLNNGIENEQALSDVINCAHSEGTYFPIIAEGGIGRPEHAKRAMELGADAVLVNTAIATNEYPVRCAGEFKKAVIDGRAAFLARH